MLKQKMPAIKPKEESPSSWNRHGEGRVCGLGHLSSNGPCNRSEPAAKARPICRSSGSYRARALPANGASRPARAGEIEESAYEQPCTFFWLRCIVAGRARGALLQIGSRRRRLWWGLQSCRMPRHTHTHTHFQHRFRGIYAFHTISVESHMY